jgi:hypothetical protein
MFGWLGRTPPPPREQQRQVAQALAEYPPYAPPEWNPDTKSLGDAMRSTGSTFSVADSGVSKHYAPSLRSSMSHRTSTMPVSWLCPPGCPSTEICLCLIWTMTLSEMHIEASQLPGQERWVVSIPYSTSVSTMPNVFGREERN